MAFENLFALADKTNSDNVEIKYIINANNIVFIDLKNKKIVMNKVITNDYSVNIDSSGGECYKDENISGKSSNELFTIDISFLDNSQIKCLTNKLVDTKLI